MFVHEFYTAWRCYSIASGSLFSEDSREYFSWDLVLGLRFYMNHSSDSPRGGGGGGGVRSPKKRGGGGGGGGGGAVLHYKSDGVLVGMSREHP